jgi:hypothetical protein
MCIDRFRDTEWCYAYGDPSLLLFRLAVCYRAHAAQP